MFKNGLFEKNVEILFNELHKNFKTFEETRSINEILLIDMVEKNDTYYIYCDLPGLNKSDIEITIDKNKMKIEAPTREFKFENEEKILIEQRIKGKKIAYFEFKSNVDNENIKASYEDGVLKIEVKKVNSEKTKIKID